MSTHIPPNEGMIPTDATDLDQCAETIDFEQLIDRQLDREEEEGSHTEFDPRVFHPSSVGYNEWLLLVNKLGLSDKSDLKGTFKVGEMIHEFIQETIRDEMLYMEGEPRDIRIEEPIEFDEDGLTFVGHADLYDPANSIVYDIKSRSSWYSFDPPVDRHIDQLHCYMRGLDADYGRVIYVSKKDLEVRQWPETVPFTFDDERWQDIKDRCSRVRDALYDEGIPQSEAEIPFEKPDEDHEQSYFVENASLDFTSVNGGDN